MDGYNGVSTSYSSFVPSYRDAKTYGLSLLRRPARRQSSLPAALKFAIRPTLVRRTTFEQSRRDIGTRERPFPG
jgi:hypothetical protein